MNEHKLPRIVLISTYPPRECGIATYSQDLLSALSAKFGGSFHMSVCAIESESEKHTYTEDVDYVLDTSDPDSFGKLAGSLNADPLTGLVLIQHEFGFFNGKEQSLLHLINAVNAPVVLTFHTVLPRPDPSLLLHVQEISAAANAITVMTEASARILSDEYGVAKDKITIIPHGTHLVPYLDKAVLKKEYGFTGRKVLSTFGLISSGKSIETTLNALPQIVAENPSVLFLIIGKTHPSVVKQEGERYREMLEQKVGELKLEGHVKFINHYLPLPDLLEYLQLTDIYLFTSKDPNQAVSGTFAYAISCGCPIVSTPIPHAKEVLKNDAGLLFGFENSEELKDAVNRLLGDEQLMENIGSNGLHRMASTAWQNVAIAHAMLFSGLCSEETTLEYISPAINADHVKSMTTDFGMIQFSQINHADIGSGYTIDDNARAMIAMCMHYRLKRNPADVDTLWIYLRFISHCMQDNGRFLNYVDSDHAFTDQNYETNLDDANGRAIWALGYLISHKNILPHDMIPVATGVINVALKNIAGITSTRAIAFALKGLLYYNNAYPAPENIALAETLADKLERMYTHECREGWNWFESYLTYGNSILPEGMLCAYLITGKTLYRSVAFTSFGFLLSNTFTATAIKPISNTSWLKRGEVSSGFGEQPIDVAYTMLALDRFYEVFADITFRNKMYTAFSWFLGNNHLHQVIYNPCTGGCYDGLEKNYVNLNQGAESTVSYMMARLTIEKYNSGYSVKQEVPGQAANIG